MKTTRNYPRTPRAKQRSLQMPVRPRDGSSLALLDGLRGGADALEGSLASFSRTKPAIAVQPSECPLGHLSQRNKNRVRAEVCARARAAAEAPLSHQRPLAGPRPSKTSFTKPLTRHPGARRGHPLWTHTTSRGPRGGAEPKRPTRKGCGLSYV